MRVRTSPIVATLLAGALAGGLALPSTTTVFAKSGHSSHSKSVTVVKGNCNAVNGSSVSHCVVISHSHRHGHNGEFEFHHHHGAIGEGLGDITEGVGDVLGGLLGGL